jgi:CubicO group peptidase (beta-lactamase class C family)/acetyl esterase/lipase
MSQTIATPSTSKLELDPRLDPRIKKYFAGMPLGQAKPNVASREELLAQENSPAALAAMARQTALFDSMDSEEVAPSAGLRVRTETLTSAPDGNTIKIRYIRPDNDETLPCVYYIHGGRMEMSSCFEGNYKTWGRMIAAKGVAVAMVDFRNSVHPSSVPEIAPFPAGLNDCVSGLKWVHANATTLNIDAKRIIIAGESGGGNLALAVGMKLKQDGELGLAKGLYSLCPYIAGEWPLPQYPSSTENDGIVLSFQDNRATMAYGIDAFNARNPLAWPSFAKREDVEGLPPTVISVNEWDPLRDEGIGFYRLLLASGVSARCRQVMGACHCIELLPVICPDISHATASDIANFAIRAPCDVGSPKTSLSDGDSALAAPLPIASPASVGFSAERLDRMDRAMQAEIDAGHYAGISIMVARHGNLVRFRRYGYQTLEGREPLREDAIFRIASMTKPIIAAAMMTLYEEGKWQLDDPVTKFIPEFADLKVLKEDKLVPLDRAMTVRHVMSTSAGFAFGIPLGSTNPKLDEMYAAAGLWSGTNDEMIAKLAKLPLEAQPGTQFRYGLQQEVQGAIIRRITGEGLDAFLAQRIFQPLRMKDTGFGVPENQRDRIAPRYTVDANLKLVLAPDQSPFPAVAGTPAGVTPKMLLSIAGLYSTAQDYLRFAQMLANGGQLDGVRVLAPSSVKLMTSNQLADGVQVHFDQPFASVGYGMNLGIVLDPARADFNGGGLGAGSFYWGGVHGTWFWVDPVNDLVVVGMVQQESAGNPPTGRPYPMPDIRGISRSITYGALTDPAL